MFKNFLLATICISANLLLAQNNVNNIYSRHHLGFFEHNENAFQLGLGGTKYALIDSTYANGSNPATLPYLSKGQPVFSLDVTGRVSFQNSGTDNTNTRVVYMRSVHISIPFAKRFGLGFGYRPVFSKGYRFADEPEDGIISKNIYRGSGGIQQAFLAFGAAPIKTKNTFVSLGLEGNFNFGQPTNIRAAEAVSGFSGLNIMSDTVRGFGFKGSIAAKHVISPNLSFSFGASYTFSSNWKTTNTDRLLQYVGVYGVNHQIMQNLGETRWKGTITTPHVLGIGFGANIKPAGKRSILRVQGDFESIAWSNYSRTSGSFVDPTFTYQNTNNYRLGFEYTPVYIFDTDATNTKFYNFFSYRLGLNINQIALPDGNLQDRGMTFGIGIPMKTDAASVSFIHLGVRAGQVNGLAQNPMRENYIAYQVGIMFRPTSRLERWFTKYKYD